ncbi:hypothetical protein T4C_9902 [Trichinella pseudospiralis]|uniref:Uncharacterized protein n=1 Tax=Trichinella pseudospiralis TaxID=6337 RepID=A0A0V1INH4_TRIPS|nr:hypothetical protein T4C_9902 [Trichinella pseudospiralis]
MLTSQLMNGCLIYIASLPNVSFHHTAAVMKWHLEQANQLKHEEVGSHHRAALSAIGICSAKAPSSNTSTPQRQATNVIKDKRQSTTGFWNYASKAAVQLTENDATHAGKLVNMAQYAERATMVIYVQFVFDRLRRLKSGRSMTPTL